MRVRVRVTTSEGEDSEFDRAEDHRGWGIVG